MGKKTVSSLMMFSTALIWGFAFVAQSVGMDHVGPFTFNAGRSAIASIFLLALSRPLRGGAPLPAKLRKSTWTGGVLFGLILFGGCTLQQFGIVYTTVSKASFISALYILLVPIIGLFLGKRTRPLAFVAALFGAFGLYLLCIEKGARFELSQGDLLVLLSTLLFSAHILVIDHFSARIDGVLASCIQFFIVAALSGVGMLFFEKPTLSGVLACWWPLAYAGFFSSGIGYTLQIIGQKHIAPAVASLILSLESVFGALFGFLLLQESFTERGLFGMLLMFGATILSQLPQLRKTSPRTLN